MYTLHRGTLGNAGARGGCRRSVLVGTTAGIFPLSSIVGAKAFYAHVRCLAEDSRPPLLEKCPRKGHCACVHTHHVATSCSGLCTMYARPAEPLRLDMARILAEEQRPTNQQPPSLRLQEAGEHMARPDELKTPRGPEVSGKLEGERRIDICGLVFMDGARPSISTGEG